MFNLILCTLLAGFALTNAGTLTCIDCVGYNYFSDCAIYPNATYFHDGVTTSDGCFVSLQLNSN